jgi:isoaspartyl peptidase/L-asparaginase-like protein (Ntn-hydrolase superfamily)
VGAASPAQAAPVAGTLKRFEEHGRLLTSTTTSGSQWDAPGRVGAACSSSPSTGCDANGHEQDASGSRGSSSRS